MDQQQNFMDSKTIIAIILVGLVWFAWQSHMQQKYPATARSEKVEVPKEKEDPAAPAKEQVVEAEIKEPTAETVIGFSDKTWSFEISSKGMGVKNLTLRKYTDRKNESIQIGSGLPHLPLSTFNSDGNVLEFALKKVSEKEFSGTARVQGATVTKKITVDSSNYLLLVELKVDGKVNGLKHLISEDSLEGSTKNAVGKNMDADPSLWQSYFVAHGTSQDHEATSASSPTLKTFEQVSVAALTGKYFGQALVDDSPIMPTFQTGYDPLSQRFLGWLAHDLNNHENPKLNLKYFSGPKSLSLLVGADSRLEKSVNYGIFGLLATPLLKLMVWLYDLTGNYGWAIVIMTILVRVGVLPFNLASYKSMKAMQVIQPHIVKLKEKHKDNPQALNQEMMKLMREHNANPLMGCLPMLLQLPVFLALYQVLDHSIELYKAPFALWIQDLSLKDPYFVLPVLMGVTMFIQQKITPTTLDPAQAKILLMMPIVFSALMLTLPSGLTLYIFVSTLFGIIQQYMFMREKSPNTTAIQAKA